MSGRPGDPAATADVPRWYVLASLAYLRTVRYLMMARVVSPRRALLLTRPWHVAAARAGMRLPARFYQAAADAGLELPGAP